MHITSYSSSTTLRHCALWRLVESRVSVLSSGDWMATSSSSCATLSLGRAISIGGSGLFPSSRHWTGSNDGFDRFLSKVLVVRLLKFTSFFSSSGLTVVLTTPIKASLFKESGLFESSRWLLSSRLLRFAWSILLSVLESFFKWSWYLRKSAR